MLPIIPALRYERDKATLMERIVLYALSCVLLLELYRMVNSQVFFSLISVTKSEYLAVVKAIIGVSVWSVIVLYIVLRLTRLFRSGDKASLLRYLRGLLYVLCLLFTAAAVVPFISGIMTSIGTSRKALDSAIDIVRMLVVFVPFVLDLAIIMRALDLLDIAMTDNQNGILNAAERLSKICCIALGTTTAITAVFNVVQVILMRWLSNVATTVDIPIISIVFICIVLLLSKLLVENKALRDDNRLII